MRTRHAIAGVLALCVALGATLMLMRRCGGEAGRTLDEAKSDAPKAPEIAAPAPRGSGAAASAETPTGVLITWHDIPDTWAAWPAAVSKAGHVSYGMTPSLHVLLTRAQSDPAVLADPAKWEAVRRANGLMNALDYLLADACKLEHKSTALNEDKTHVPLFLFDGVMAPADPKAARDGLIAMLSGGFADLVGKTPPQFAGPGLEEAFRVRAIGLLAGLGPDPGVVPILQEHLRTGDRRARAAAAYGLLVQGDATACREILAEGESNAAYASLIGSLSAPHWKGTGPQKFVPDVPVDRSLDANILEAAKRSPRRELIECLAQRTDNADVRTYLASLIETTDDVGAVGGIVGAYAQVAEDPAYFTAAQRWTGSHDSTLRDWGLMAIGQIRNAAIPKLIAPMLETEDARLVSAAVRAQVKSAPLDPITVMAGVRSLSARHKLAPGIEIYTRQALADIYGAEHVDPAVRVEAEEMHYQLFRVSLRGKRR